MFGDLYRLAEHYEDPPFKPGDVDGNGDFFIRAMHEVFLPFTQKYKDMRLATALAMDIVDECSARAAEFNKMKA